MSIKLDHQSENSRIEDSIYSAYYYYAFSLNEWTSLSGIHEKETSRIEITFL